MTRERQAQSLMKRLTLVRELLSEMETDCTEWETGGDVDVRSSLAVMKRQLDDAALLLTLLQPIRKH
jgi:hypothetical protein